MAVEAGGRRGADVSELRVGIDSDCLFSLPSSFRMEPNFEDFSCTMTFGKRPPPLEEDPVSQQPCLATCATGVAGGARCHKLD